MKCVYALLLGASLAVSASVGCGPAVSRDELGEVVLELPEVPGAKEPYKLPEFLPPPGKQPTVHVPRSSAPPQKPGS
ncbi:MAG: hypothetical protein ACYC35_29190 [Pirellulales bacterium]